MLTLDAAKEKLNERKGTKITQKEALAAKVKEKERGEREQNNIDVLDNKYQTLDRIADVSNGSNNKRTSSRRFILQILLDEVLEIASHRLMKMTTRGSSCPGMMACEMHASSQVWI